MAGGGFAVTKDARRATRIGGHLRGVEKATANRRNRRAARSEVRARGEDALLVPKLYTGWDVI